MVCRYNVVIKPVCQLGNNLIEINFLKIGSHKSQRARLSNGPPEKLKKTFHNIFVLCNITEFLVSPFSKTFIKESLKFKDVKKEAWWFHIRSGGASGEISVDF